MRYVILFRPGPNWVEGKSIFDQPLWEHGQYMQELYDAGRLIMAGPFTDDAGGMAILDVADEQAAREILAKDPAVISGVFTGEVHPWMVVFDRIAGRSLRSEKGRSA